ncbi:MAG: hypothetical protein K8S27_07120 [Candidatus Omnitrophica bacterium]|nr:hypothetical protein [Candidatus Omnitrophota bacterium]
MKKKAVFLVAIIGLTFAVNSVYAEHHKRKPFDFRGKTCDYRGMTCDFRERSCDHRGGCRKDKKFLEDKLMKIFHVIYEYQEEMGVTDEQLSQIKAIKVALKKELIQKKADVEVVMVDFYALLHEDELDLETIIKLVDQKYEAKKSKLKKLVLTYAELKKILSKKQMDQLKELKHGKKRSSLPAPMKKLIPPSDK